MIDKYEQTDRSVSPSVAYERGRSAAKLGLHSNPYTYRTDELGLLMRQAWEDGYAQGCEERKEQP